MTDHNHSHEITPPSMVDKLRIESLIETLAYSRVRPGSYFIKDFPVLATWLDGFLYACRTLGFEHEPEYTNIWREKGRNLDPHGPIYELQQAGMTAEQITAEVLGVLLLAFQRKYVISAEPILRTHRTIRHSLKGTLASLEKPLGLSSEAAERHHQESTRQRIEHELWAIEKLEADMGISSNNSEDN